MTVKRSGKLKYTKRGFQMDAEDAMQTVGGKTDGDEIEEKIDDVDTELDKIDKKIPINWDIKDGTIVGGKKTDNIVKVKFIIIYF